MSSVVMQTDKIKILHLIASNFVGGPEKQILQHACDAASAEREVWIGSFRDRPSRPEILDRASKMGIPTIEIFKSVFSARVICELTDTFRQRRMSLLCTHGFKANVLGWIVSRLTGLPHVAFARGWTAETWRVKQYEKLDRFVLSRTRWVVCVSCSLADQLRSKKKSLPAPIIIPNSALFLEEPRTPSNEGVLMRMSLGISADDFVVCSVGRLSSEKGHIHLVNAVPALLTRFPNLRVVVLGDGRDRRSLQKRAEELGVGHAIVFAGFQRDVRPWIQSSNVLVNPSLTEGMPNVVLEAMALGTPVIATAVGGVPDLIRHQATGLLVPPGSPDAISEAVAELLVDRTKALQIAINAKKRAQDFSPARQLESLLELYAAVLNLPKRAREGPRRAQPYVSVIIPVRNEEEHIRELLRDLLAQDYPADCYEIIVADGNSTDRTRKIVEDCAARARPRIRYVHNPKELSSAGRNLGVLNSHGDVVLFIDGHCRVPNTNLFRSVVTAFERTGADCLCRPQPLNMAGNTWFQDIVAHARASFVGHGLDSTIYFSNCDGFVDPTSSGAIYKRSVFERVGLYDEQFDACEDVEFNHRVRRAGLSSYLSSRLAIQYRPRSNLCALFKQLFRYGRGRFRLIRKHRDALSYSQLVPAGFVLWLLLAGLLSVASRYAAIALAVTVGVYMGVLLLAGAGLALRRGFLHFFVAPAVYATIHIGLGCGFWTEMCRSTRDLFSKSGGQSQAVGTAKPEVSQLSRESGSQC